MPNSRKTLAEFEKSAETGVETSFKNSVTGKTARVSAGKRLEKKSPLIALVLSLIIGGGLIFASQSLMPFAIVNRFIEEFNTIGISSTLRADNILDYQLEYAGGFFSLSESQRTNFSEHGLEPVDFVLNSSRSTALIFKNSSGTLTPVVSKNVLEKSSESNILSAIKSANSSLENLGSPISVASALENSSFKTAYTSASKTYRGGNSGWYDTLTNLTEARLSITRSRYANWTAAVLNSGETEAFNKLASSKKVSDGGLSDYGTYSETAEDGTETTSGTNGVVNSDSLTAATTADEVRAVLNSKITSAAKLAATAGCVGVEVLSTIQTIMSVQQSIQYLNVASGYFEAVQKTQAGLGSESPMNDYNRRLVATDPETGKTAMNSGGISSLFTGNKMSSSDESVKTTNFESLGSSLGSLTGNIAFTAKAFETCAYINMGVAGLNLATTIMNFVPVLGQSVAAIHIVAKVVGKIALGIAVGEIIAFVVPKILDSVVKNVISDAATDWLGADLSNAMTSGANKYIGGNAQTGGGSGADAKALAVYRREQETVIAEEADQERKTKSPFDITSEYTFLGSLAHSFLSFATSTTVSGLINSFSSLLSSSVVKTLPTANAVAETNLLTSIGDCPTLESVGMVGDVYCNPYFITDKTTIELSPTDVIKAVYDLDHNNFKSYSENGAVEINPDSNLGKYIKYCGQRNSSFGVADASITNQIVQGSSSLVSNLPLVGDVSQLISAATRAENMPWISGSACTASEENPLWQENKYYQRFSEDQRLYESAGLVKKSAVTAMLEEYYEKNPLDNSRAGIIARFSGLEKSDVVAALDIIDGLVYLAKYDPDSRFNFNETISSVEPLDFSDSSLIPENRLYLTYDNLLQRIRQRSLALAAG
ncbi:hypothetical protein IJH66_01270 [Candidatus Saccharibacteria bacterium]|nr:hypothetical protein [Candidatus Saccharibacteria bacterium]